MLREFVEQQFPASERPAFAFLLEKIFDKMSLAGEAGSLLRIEEEIQIAVAEAHSLARKQSEKRQKQLFADTDQPRQKQMEFDLRGLTDEEFWHAAEQRIYEALEAYAEQTENGSGFQRRLFAADAAQGFAFIDLCRKRYDVVVMNPPFGELSSGAKSYLFGAYPLTKNDLFACFTERWAHKATQYGRLGAITSRSGFFFTSFQAWREKILLDHAKPVVLADLGYGVLDSAMVETAAYVLEIARTDSPLLCFRLLEDENKSGRLLSVTDSLNSGKPDSVLHICVPSQFSRIPGAPFAYWVGERVTNLFSDFRPFAGQGRKASGGIGTTDDFRFIRCWWEIPPTTFATSKEKALKTNAFVPIALGGQTSRFYAATTAVVKFGRNGLELKTFVEEKLGSASRNVRGQEFYFRPGLTWPLRGKLFSAWPVPAGCVFSVAGKIATTENEAELPYLLGLFNSLPFDFLVGLSAGKVGDIRIQHQSGLIDRIPFREFDASGRALGVFAKSAWEIKWRQDTCELLSHAFTLPSLLQFAQASLQMSCERWDEHLTIDRGKLEDIQASIDVNALDIYGLERADVLQPQTESRVDGLHQTELSDGETDEEFTELGDTSDIVSAVANLTDYLVGTVFGRWDIRYATGERLAPELPDPFAPLPVCPPGMLQGDDGLPLLPEAGRRLRTKGGYPFDVAWDGILVDDAEHSLDVSGRVRQVLAVLWSDQSDAIELEACDPLGVKSLADWFRRPNGFFADHLKRYSKSRRKSPIYWPLSIPSSSYTVWLYYHRFSKDTFFKTREIVSEKLMYEQTKLERLKSEYGAQPTRSQTKELETQEKISNEIKALYEEVDRIAPLWNPNLNDGVIINFAPLWRLVPHHKAWQKECKECWDSLVAGEYDWAHLAMHLWPERVVPRCHSDRSLAIAHDVEELLWIEDGKSRPIKSPNAEIDDQRSRRSSHAFTAFQKAMDSLAEKVGDDFSASEAWNHLSDGDWDDSDVAMLLWPRRVVLKCFEDEALAKTHRINDRALSNVKQSGSNDIVVERVIDYHEKFSCSTLLDSLKSEMSRAEGSFAEFWEYFKQADYDYSELSLRLWPDRIVNQCTEDIDVAKEQNMLQFFWVKGQNSQWRRRRSPEKEIADEIGRRNSSAVKASLESLLTAPVPAGNSKSRRRKATT